MAATQPIIKEGLPMMEIKNIFFKASPAINYFANEAEAEAIENRIAFQHFNRSLECSNKHGCVILTFNNSFYLLRVNDILSQQSRGGDEIPFKDLIKLEIKNDFLPAAPNIISLSNEEDYLAVDTVRGDSAWTVIFKFSDFIQQGGLSRPFCEIRCPAASSRINSICWNPGEGLGSLLSISTEDGTLFLAKVIGQNNVELNRFAEGGVRCCCWSPKGKQLVIGRMDGRLSQLRLDLTEAKQIPAPELGSIPISILWTQTTQFLVVFYKSDDSLDFMQLDVPKGVPPMYISNKDIVISEVIPAKCSCFFVPLMQWNIVLTMTNSSSDVVVLFKTQQGSSNELWIPGDIADNRRASFLLDNSARGAGIYFGCSTPVTFSEVESYPPMPMLFLLSQRGSLLIYSVINSDTQATSLNVDVSAPIADTIFSTVRPTQVLSSAVTPAATKEMSASIFKVTSNVPVQPSITQPAPTTVSLQSVKPEHNAPFSIPLEHSSQAGKSAFGLPQTVDGRQLGTSTLPSVQDMAGLQKAVEEKRREMTTQLHKGVALKALEEDDQCVFVISEIRKFEQRLADFKKIVDSQRGNLTGLVNMSFGTLEKNVLTSLNVVEDFSSDMVSTTKAQKEEVDTLKERILNHFSQLEYAKSLVERSRDPRYLEHLRSRPLDPASQQKFEEIKKLHNYLKNQIAECRRYFYEQNRNRDLPIDRVSYTQLIYLTLSNHSKIIRRLQSELDSIKERLGLGRHYASNEEIEYFAISEAKYTKAKKSNNVSDFAEDEITLNDLTAGISRVKLNRESDRPDKKPIKLANRKLFILKKCMSEVTVIKVKAEDNPWTRPPTKTASRPKPVTYPTASIEESISKLLDSKSGLDANSKSTFAINNESSSHIESAFQSNFGNSTKLMGKASPAAGLWSMPESSNPVKFSDTPSAVSTTSSSKSGNVSFSSSPKPQSPASSVPSILKSSNQTTFVAPSTQLPTLAGLLAAPLPANTSSSNIFPVTGYSFTNVSTTQNKGLSFETGTFAAGTQQVPAAKATINVPTSDVFSLLPSGTVATPNTTLTTSFASFSLPGTASSNSSNLISPTMTNIFTGVGTGAFSTKSSVSAASNVQSVGGDTKTPTSSLATKTTGVPISGLASSLILTDTSGKGTLPSSSGPITASDLKTPIASPVGIVSVKPTVITSSTEQAAPIIASTTPVQITSPAVATALPFKSGISVGKVTVGTVNPGVMPSSIAAGTLTNPKIESLSPSTVTIQSPGLSNVPSQATFTSIPHQVTPSSVFATPTTAATSDPSFSSNMTVSKGVFSTIPASSSGGVLATNLVSVPSSGLFSSTQISSPSGLFSSISTTTAASPLFASTPATTSGSATFASIPTTTTAVGLFTSSPATTSATGLFSSTPTTSSGTGLFSSTPVTTAPTGLFSSISTTAAPAGLFSSIPSTTTSTGLFSAIPATTVSTGLFSSTPATTSTGIFSTTPVTPATTSTGIFSTTPVTPATTAATGIFSTTPVTPATTAATGLFSSTSESTASGGLFAIPAAGDMFTPPSTSAPGSNIFASAPVSSAPSGLFSSTSVPTPPGGLFSSTTSTSSTTSAGLFASTGFLSPITTTTSATGTGFMSSLNISDTDKSTPGAGLFSANTLGLGAPTASIFGGSGNPFGSQTTAGSTNSSGSTTQTGFGVFGQSKPTAGVFGSPTPAAAPVFGGTAAFGGSSPFGSSFGGAGASSFGSGGANVFGSSAPSGGQSTGFGTLAQQSTTGSAFGSPFGGSTGQQQPSAFGSPTQQKPAATGVFGGGGSAFGTTTSAGAFSSGTTTGGVAQQGFGFGQTKPSGGTGFGSPPPSAAPVFGGGATFGSSSPFGSSFAPSPTSTFGSTGASVFGGTGAVQNTGFGVLAQQGGTSSAFGSPGSTGFGGGGSLPQQQQQPLFGSPQQQTKPVFGGQAFSSWR